jgi:hypothetical protein
VKVWPGTIFKKKWKHICSYSNVYILRICFNVYCLPHIRWPSSKNHKPVRQSPLGWRVSSALHPSSGHTGTLHRCFVGNTRSGKNALFLSPHSLYILLYGYMWQEMASQLIISLSFLFVCGICSGQLLKL